MIDYESIIPNEKEEYKKFLLHEFTKMGDEEAFQLLYKLRTLKSQYLRCSIIYLLCDRNRKDLVEQAFETHIRDIFILKIFCEIFKEGLLNKKSFGTFYKNLIKNKLVYFREPEVFKCVDQDEEIGMPMKSIILLTHPKPTSPLQEMVFCYFLNKNNKPLKDKIIRKLKEY